MKHSEVQRLNELFNDWVSFEEKQRDIEDICRSGPTQESKMIEYHGDFPQLSIVRPDVLSIKVEKARRIVITKEERRAATLINAFPIRPRAILTEHHKRRNRNNPLTNNNWTHRDIAQVLNLRYERYQELRNELCKLLLRVDKSENPEKSAEILSRLLKAPRMIEK